MKTLKLDGVAVEISNASISKSAVSPANATGKVSKTLNASVILKVNGKTIVNFGKCWDLTDAELSGTNLDGIEDLAMSRLSAELAADPAPEA